MVREVLTLRTLLALSPPDAAARIVALKAEGLTPVEEAEVSRWLADDVAHRRALASADQAWRIFDDPEGDEILAAMRVHALAPQRRAWPSLMPAAAAAAVVVVAVGVAFQFGPSVSRGPPTSETVTDAPRAVVYTTGRAEVKEIQLSDGSRITLDADSALDVSVGAKARSVRMSSGRAYFIVAPDTARPFSVRVANRQVTALGTRFDVNLTPGALSVSLLEGRVTVGAGARVFTLEPGQQYLGRGERETVRSLGVRAQDVGAWRQGFVTFDDQSLEDAVAVMNRYARAQILIRDPHIAALRVTGQFRSDGAERFVRDVAELHNLRIVQRAEQVELVRKS